MLQTAHEILALPYLCDPGSSIGTIVQSLFSRERGSLLSALLTYRRPETISSAGDVGLHAKSASVYACATPKFQYTLDLESEKRKLIQSLAQIRSEVK